MLRLCGQRVAVEPHERGPSGQVEPPGGADGTGLDPRHRERLVDREVVRPAVGRGGVAPAGQQDGQAAQRAAERLAGGERRDEQGPAADERERATPAHGRGARSLGHQTEVVVGLLGAGLRRRGAQYSA